MTDLTDREQLLVALGAALGANCVPCVESIVPKAHAAGISDADLEAAVDLADKVRRKPARLVLQTARGLLKKDVQAEDEGPCPLEGLGESRDHAGKDSCFS